MMLYPKLDIQLLKSPVSICLFITWNVSHKSRLHYATVTILNVFNTFCFFLVFPIIILYGIFHIVAVTNPIVDSFIKFSKDWLCLSLKMRTVFFQYHLDMVESITLYLRVCPKNVLMLAYSPISSFHAFTNANIYINSYSVFTDSWNDKQFIIKCCY